MKAKGTCARPLSSTPAANHCKTPVLFRAKSSDSQSRKPSLAKTVANNAQPEKIRNGTLFIKVSSPVWMQQLQYMKEMIAEKLNQRLGSQVVKNIFFVVGRIDPVSSDSAGPAIDESTAAPRKIDTEFLQSVTDPDIRQAFERLVKSYARRKAKR